jgi:hypothetical protein
VWFAAAKGEVAQVPTQWSDEAAEAMFVRQRTSKGSRKREVLRVWVIMTVLVSIGSTIDSTIHGIAVLWRCGVDV